MEALAGEEHAPLDEPPVDAGWSVFGADGQFRGDKPAAGNADGLFQIDESATLAGLGTVTLATSGTPNGDFRVDLGIAGNGNAARLTFGASGASSADTASKINAGRFAAFAETAFAILAGEIEKTGADPSLVCGYAPRGRLGGRRERARRRLPPRPTISRALPERAGPRHPAGRAPRPRARTRANPEVAAPELNDGPPGRRAACRGGARSVRAAPARPPRRSPPARPMPLRRGCVSGGARPAGPLARARGRGRAGGGAAARGSRPPPRPRGRRT